MTNFRFRKENRLRSTPEFQRVYRGKQSVSDKILIVYALPNDLGRMRLGVSVSRKIGNAVVRNRWKRLIREAFRLDLLPNGERFGHSVLDNSALDIIVLPQKGVSLVSFETLRQSLQRNLQRLEKKIFS